MQSDEKLTSAQVTRLTEFLRYIFQEIVEPLDKKLSAFQAVIAGLEDVRPALATEINAALNVALQSPVLLERLHNEYHVTLEKWLHSALEKVESQDLSGLEIFVKNWPKDRLN
jgi:hypothetical protein